MYAAFLGSSIRQSDRLLTGWFQVQVLAEEPGERARTRRGLRPFCVLGLEACGARGGRVQRSSLAARRSRACASVE